MKTKGALRILVSGAGVAGPVLAYWLTRHGFSVTVVERAPVLRRLVFDEESRFNAFIGAYLGVLTLPNISGLDGELLIHVGVGRTAGMYGARHLGDARALFLFRSERELDHHHRDVPRQKELLRGAFAGMHAHVDRWLDELDRTPAFYFDSSQSCTGWALAPSARDPPRPALEVRHHQ